MTKEMTNFESKIQVLLDNNIIEPKKANNAKRPCLNCYFLDECPRKKNMPCMAHMRRKKGLRATSVFYGIKICKNRTK